MANYYKQSDPNNITTKVSLSTIIKGITDSNINSKFNNQFDTASKTFKSTINEAPSEIQYLYNGVDIYTNCIAYNIVGNSTGNIPSWCNKIRAVLVGGGAGGQSGQTGKNNAAVNQNKDHTDIFKNQYYGNSTQYQNTDTQRPGTTSNAFQQTTINYTGNYGDQGYRKQTNARNVNAAANQNTGSNGYGGGGGAFIYIDNMSVTPGSSIQSILGSGGQLATSGQGTTLKIYTTANAYYTYIAGGGSYSSSGGGGGGTTTANFFNSNNSTNTVTINTKNPGGSATSITPGTSGLTTTYIDTTSYGNGGKGSLGTGGGVNPGSANSGTDGYIVVYYLTG